MEKVKVRMLRDEKHGSKKLKAGDSAEVPADVAWGWIHSPEPVAIAENGQAIVEPDTSTK